MASQPRRRAIVKWAGAAGCVSLLALWLLSGWLLLTGFVFASGQYMCEAKVLTGRLELSCHIDPDLKGLDFREGPSIRRVDGWNGGAMWEWRFSFRHRGAPPGSRSWNVKIPLHAPLLALLLPAAYLFYRDRRSLRQSREGRCAGCGYDLSGASGKCPECGHHA